MQFGCIGRFVALGMKIYFTIQRAAAKKNVKTNRNN